LERDEENPGEELPAERYDLRSRRPLPQDKAAQGSKKRKHRRDAAKAESPVVVRVQAAAGITEYVDLTVEWSPQNGNLNEVPMKKEVSEYLRPRYSHNEVISAFHNTNSAQAIRSIS
jgi:hypothetical protein